MKVNGNKQEFVDEIVESWISLDLSHRAVTGRTDRRICHPHRVARATELALRQLGLYAMETRHRCDSLIHNVCAYPAFHLFHQVHIQALSILLDIRLGLLLDFLFFGFVQAFDILDSSFERSGRLGSASACWARLKHKPRWVYGSRRLCTCAACTTSRTELDLVAGIKSRPNPFAQLLPVLKRPVLRHVLQPIDPNAFRLVFAMDGAVLTADLGVFDYQVVVTASANCKRV